MLLMTLEAFAAALIARRYSRLPVGAGLLSYVSGTILLLYIADFAGALQPTTKFLNDFVGSTVVSGSADTLLAIAWKGLAGLSISDVLSVSLLWSPGPAMAATALASFLLILPWRTTAARLRHLVFSKLLLAGVASYVVSLLTAYLHTYSDYEAETLASFDRFLNVYSIGWILAVSSAALCAGITAGTIGVATLSPRQSPWAWLRCSGPVCGL